ncbi:MAG: nucleotidyltransferase domain-containing protein, partial [Candidatus Nanoarchaeia archaeon]
MGQKEYLVKNLKKFIKDLGRDIKVSKVILFGSRAKKNFKEESDVDLIIVSDDFKEKNFFERASKMYDYWEINLPVDILCYTNMEFYRLKK